MKISKSIKIKNIKAGFYDKANNSFIWLAGTKSSKVIYLDNAEDIQKLANWLLIAADKMNSDNTDNTEK